MTYNWLVYLFVLINSLILHGLFTNTRSNDKRMFVSETFFVPVFLIGNRLLTKTYMSLLSEKSQLFLIGKLLAMGKTNAVNRFIKHSLQSMTSSSLLKIAISGSQYKRIAFTKLAKRKNVPYEKLKNLMLDIYWKEQSDISWINRLDF